MDFLLYYNYVEIKSHVGYMQVNASFTFDKGLYDDSFICAVVSSDDESWDNRLLYYNPKKLGDEAEKATELQRKINFNNYRAHMTGKRPNDRNDLVEYFNICYTKGIEVIPELKEMYDNILADAEFELPVREVSLPSGCLFEPYPIGNFQVFYIYGSMGSGKSYFSSIYARNYFERFGKSREIYLVTNPSADNDPAFTRFKGLVRRVKTETFLDDPPDVLKEFKNTLVIYDDVDTLDKPLLNIVDRMRDTAVSLGRKNNISTMFLTHYPSNYAKTRLILGEATDFVVYFDGASEEQLKNVLKKYGNIDMKYFKTLQKIPSRWVQIHKNPRFILSEFKAMILE